MFRLDIMHKMYTIDISVILYKFKILLLLFKKKFKKNVLAQALITDTIKKKNCQYHLIIDCVFQQS